MTWRRALPASALAPGEVVAVAAGDLRTAVWRTVDGTVAACDARCPHQWADLASGGHVLGDQLVCTAHGWRFDAEGRGTKVDVRGRCHETADATVVLARVEGGWIELDLPV